MKNVSIPPQISLIIGIILVIIARIILNTKETIPQFVQFLGFILAIIGFAGLLGKLFSKK